MDNLYNINDEVFYNEKHWEINAIQIYIEKSNINEMPDPDEEPAIRVEYHLIRNNVIAYSNGKPVFEEAWDVPEEYLCSVEDVEEAEEEKRLHDRDVSRTIYENTRGNNVDLL